MSWINTFLEKLFPTKETYGADPSAVVIDIPAALYYKELAVYTVSSLIGNAIGRSEFKVYEHNEPVKNNQDYYLLNISPNRNETSSIFWHKVVNRMIRHGEALIVDAGGRLYCADFYTKIQDRPVLGDIYGNVSVGTFTFNRVFTQEDAFIVRLDDVEVKKLIDGIYQEYGKILSSAAKALKLSSGQKYKLHIDGVKAGDEEFNKEFEEHIKNQLKSYLESENAVYPEFDGYKLEGDPVGSENDVSGYAEQFISLRKDLFSMVASTFHVPDSMLTGNITSMNDIINSFLTFGVDPYADAITEALNKRAGIDNFKAGNYYQVDTSSILHRDVFSIASGASNLISSGVMCIDEVREELGRSPLGTDWSQKHFITKNFEEIERFLSSAEGGE